MRPYVYGGAALLFLASGVYLGFRFDADPEPSSDPATVDTVRVVEERVAPETSFVERIKYRDRPAEVRVVVDTVMRTAVDTFVAHAVDTVPSEPIHLPYSFDYGVDGDTKLRMWGALSDGSLSYAEHDVEKPFKAGWAGDSTYAREHRLSRFPKWKVAGGVVVAGGVILCLAVC